MKYEYGNIESKNIIKNYTIVNDKIIIHFLDNSVYKIPFTKENENNLLKKLLEQAEDRNKYSTINDVSIKNIKDIIFTTIYSLMTAACMYGLASTEDDDQKFLLGIVAGCTGLKTIVYLIQHIIHNDELEELKKYDIYLSMREKLEEFKNDDNVIQFFKNGEELTINTLDDYSLKEIKGFNNILQKCKKYSKR